MRQVQRPELGRGRHDRDAASGALVLAAEPHADQLIVLHATVLDLSHFASANRHHAVGLEAAVDQHHVAILDQLFRFNEAHLLRIAASSFRLNLQTAASSKTTSNPKTTSRSKNSPEFSSKVSIKLPHRNCHSKAPFKRCK